MTVNTELSKRIYTGNGVATDYDYDFKIPLASDLAVSLFDLDGVELPQVLNTDYTVTGAGGDNGGKVLFTIPPPSGYTILLLSDAAYTQPTDFKNQGRFFPETHENALDRITILARQNREAINRSITLPPQVEGVSTQLPVPQASTLFGWNSASNGFQNFPLATIATQIAYGDKNYQVFTGTGAQADFTLSQDPGSLGNLAVSIDGVVQVPGDDYTYSDTTLTFTSAPGNGAVVLVRYDVAVPVGSALASAVTFRQAETGSELRPVEDKLREAISVKDFGAVGDGLADDTQKLIAAITASVSSNRRLDFGDRNNVYRITSSIIVSVSGNLRMMASGASILFDPPSPSREFLRFNVTGGEHVIDGKLILDANQKAFIGLYFNNDEDGSSESHFGDLTLADVQVRNVYRSSTAFSGGDGIWVRGCWGKVIMERPDVRNCAMAAGAGVGGSQGIFGITVSASASASFRYCSITDPYIDGVYCEDDTYTLDQDGIRLFDKGEDGARLYPWETFFDVRGGEIRNCRGRSIKGQANYGTVRGTKFYRDDGNSTGIGNPEIDFQVGGGSVSDIECLYVGTVPSLIFQGTASATTDKRTPSFRLNGISAVVSPGSPKMTAIAGISAAASGSNSVRAFVSNVDLIGAAAASRMVQVRGRGDDNLLSLSNVYAGVDTELVYLWLASGASSATTRVFARDIVNTGSLIPFVSRDSDANRRVIASSHNVVGALASDKFISSSGDAHPVMTRVEAIAPAVNYGSNGSTGLIRPISVQINDGATYTVPDTGYSGVTGILIVAVGASRNSQGIFAVDANAAVAVTGIGSDWTVGTTSDPGSGNWRIWGSSGGVQIKNASGSNRQVTILAIG